MDKIRSLSTSGRTRVQLILVVLGGIAFIIYLGFAANKVATSNLGTSFQLDFVNETTGSLPAWILYTIGGGKFGPIPNKVPSCIVCCWTQLIRFCLNVDWLNITSTRAGQNFTDMAYAFNYNNSVGNVWPYFGTTGCPRIECTFPNGTDTVGISLYDQAISPNMINFGGPEMALPGGWFDVRVDSGYYSWVLWRKEVYLFQSSSPSNTSISYNLMGTTTQPAFDLPGVIMIPGTPYVSYYNQVQGSTYYGGVDFIGDLGGFLGWIIVGFMVTLTILEIIFPSIKENVHAEYQSISS